MGVKTERQKFGGERGEVRASLTPLCGVGGEQGTRAPVTTLWFLPLFYQ